MHNDKNKIKSNLKLIHFCWTFVSVFKENGLVAENSARELNKIHFFIIDFFERYKN